MGVVVVVMTSGSLLSRNSPYSKVKNRKHGPNNYTHNSPNEKRIFRRVTKSDLSKAYGLSAQNGSDDLKERLR